MAIIRLQGEKERQEGIYYEFDDTSRPLGEGGMGKVFRGRRVNEYTKVSREVAIKFMFSGLPPHIIRRAEDEANIRIASDNLVEMMGFLTVENKMANGAVAKRYHVISELLIGVSLSDLMQGVLTDQLGNEIPYARRLYTLYNTSPTEFARIVIEKILSGIMALHDGGYIHRDIDPSNVMITRDEKIKLIDFGIAKNVTKLKTNDRNLTSAGQFLGKPQYAAPELILGDIKNQNKPTDIYAVGVLFFQLVTGHLPFEGSHNAVLNCHLNAKMPLKQISDSRIRKIIAKATAKEASERYQTAAEFRADVDALSRTKPKPSVDMRLVWGGVGALVLALVVVAAVKLIDWGPKQPIEPDPVPAEETIEEKNNQDSNELESLQYVKSQLMESSKAKEGYENLKKLVNEGNVEAKFILSQLYAVSVGSATVNDDFVIMQENLEGVVKPDAKKSHALLLEVEKADSEYYPALYELGCDYYIGAERGVTMNLDVAENYLLRAFDYAQKKKDPIYKNRIKSLLNKI